MSQDGIDNHARADALGDPACRGLARETHLAAEAMSITSDSRRGIREQ